MNKILFICTANIFRSRFSEETFNYLAKKNNLNYKAFSAGLKVGQYVIMKMAAKTIKHLDLIGIKPVRSNERSIHVDDLNLEDYQRIICMDKIEHYPMVQSNCHLKNLKIEYWDIIDEPKVKGDVSMPYCYKRVNDLILEIKKSI
tara:strand:- start:1752 stop:2186 length:435 start_codon:yes stop_codon:yes gene_type:complete